MVHSCISPFDYQKARKNQMWEAKSVEKTIRSRSQDRTHTADRFFCVFHRKSLRYAALGTGCTLTAVPRSTQPSTLQGIKYVSTLWLSNNTNGDRECSAYSSLQADSEVKFAAWPTSWRPPDSDADFHSEDPSKLSHMALCHS